MERCTYSIKEVALLIGKSENLIYRRLTEKDSKFIVRFARKEGNSWVFDKGKVDETIERNESIIIRKTDQIVDIDTALKYFFKESRSCGKDYL